MDRAMKITLDTNVFSRKDISFVRLLIDCQNKGIVAVSIGSTVLAELEQIPDLVWREETLNLAAQMHLLPQLDKPELLQMVYSAVFPGIHPEQNKYAKRQKDAVILAQYISSSGGYFITRDRHFLQHRDRLYELFKARVVTPEEIRNKL